MSENPRAAMGQCASGDVSDTRCVRLTPAMPAAIATIAVQGPSAVRTVLKLVSLRTDELREKRIYYGLWNMASEETALGQPSDGSGAEQVVVCRTASETVEVHCHGGVAVCQQIERQLVAAGCAVSDSLQVDYPVSPLRLSAEQALLLAQTDRVAGILLDQSAGALDHRILAVRDAVTAGEWSGAASLLGETLTWAPLGRRLTAAWRVVLAGPPNSGKSSLTNAIVGSARSIVHATPGTTRDWIQVATAIEGWPITITDTAGIRDGADAIERQGIKYATQQIEAADAVVIVVDAAVGWTETHSRLLGMIQDRPFLVAWNKCDLSQETAIGCPASLDVDSVIRISCVAEPGIAHLLPALVKLLVPNTPPAGTPVPFSDRVIAALVSVTQCVEDQDESSALRELDEICR